MFGLKRKKYRTLEDAELLDFIRNQEDNHAFSELYVRYAHLVLGLCLKYVRDEVEAQEITSTIFEQLTSKIKKFEIQHFKSWLYTLTKNECFMFLRKQRFIFDREIFDSLRMEEESSEHHEMEAQIELLEDALKELKPQQYEVIRLFYLEKKSYHEVASETGLDLKTVKSAIQNGKRNLKIMLESKDAFNELK
jgi:RNA polymerase sigma factor (sigma-70 family)